MNEVDDEGQELPPEAAGDEIVEVEVNLEGPVARILWQIANRAIREPASGEDVPEGLLLVGRPRGVGRRAALLEAAATLVRELLALEPTACGAEEPITSSVLQDLLSLVLHPEPPPLEVIEAWTEAEREAAERWAAAAHLQASDHDDVDVPPRPDFLEPWDRAGRAADRHSP